MTDRDFKNMLVYSAGLHLLAGSTLFFLPQLFYKPLIDPAQSTSTMNVMWAETVTSPEKTVEHKLPGPEIPPPPAAEPEASSEPKYVVDPKPNKAAVPSPKKTEPTDRKKQMKDALAGLGVSDDRPMPKLDNFQSVDGAEKKGMPASPFGGGLGKMAGDPEFAKYKNSIQKITNKNFVWIRPDANFHTEITFKLSPDGTVLNPVIYKSSGNSAYDNAALRAVLKSSPLPEPPEKFRQQILKEYFVVIFDPRMK